MRRILPILATVALWANLACHFYGDNSELDDDDAVDDDSADDDGDCTVDLASAGFTAVCVDTGPGTGTWTFGLELDCWAASAWVQAWTLEEFWGGLDPETGDPGECAAAAEMTHLDSGHDEVQGYYDIWGLEVDFDLESDDPCLFPFSCDEAGSFELWYCACDPVTDSCYCVEDTT